MPPKLLLGDFALAVTERWFTEPLFNDTNMRDLITEEFHKRFELVEKVVMLPKDWTYTEGSSE